MSRARSNALGPQTAAGSSQAAGRREHGQRQKAGRQEDGQRNCCGAQAGKSILVVAFLISLGFARMNDYFLLLSRHHTLQQHHLCVRCTSIPTSIQGYFTFFSFRIDSREFHVVQLSQPHRKL